MMTLGGEGDPVTRLAEPALEQFPDKIVRFDDNDTALRVQAFPRDVQNVDVGRAYCRTLDSICVAVPQYARDPSLDDN